ncbi:MAG: polyprenyl synthetase family protein [Alphaproteobacteria bacterium]|nr:polyprenyl synthetase family protein [Alphaproteobacteria bacterium]
MAGPVNLGTDPSGLSAAMEEAVRDVEATLERLLPRPEGLHARIHEAMRYAIFAGGKRLRPFLVLSSAALFDVKKQSALRVAAAIEAIHTYSLVHDDLPCMDDDDLRRGRPTTHKAFDEATAVLAGDALLTLAFEILAHPDTHPSAEVRCRLIAKLAQAAGHAGMIGGQMIDIEAETRTFAAGEVVLLQAMKTGALFEFSCEAGAILGEAQTADHERLRGYARDFGLAFQITDDLLDVLGTAEKVGKSVGKDKDQGKATLVSIKGVEGAREEARKLIARAGDTLDFYGGKAKDLRALALFLLDRES